MFGDDKRSSAHVDNKKKDMLIFGDGLVQGLDGTTLSKEKEYSVNITKQLKKLCLLLHYSGVNSYIFVNVVEIQKFKAKDSEPNAAPICLGNASKDFSVDNMKKTGLHGYVDNFSADYDAIADDDILDIHKYLIKKNGI